MKAAHDLPETAAALDPHRLPRHVAIIMDGNGRWARRQGLRRVRGHLAGAESVRVVVRLARRLGLQYLTLYAFSEENWQRPPGEIRALMGLLVRYLRQERSELQQNQIALKAIGDLTRLPANVQEELARTIAATATGNGMTLTVALSYGGRSEIVQAVRSLARKILAGQVKPEEITQELFARHLYTGDMPDPDLLIRTSGEYRLSNFLLWQSAYTELYITETLWPDFREEEFIKALLEYQQRDRRFGLTQEQIATLNSANLRH
jgi:undecaprenyl diphosphate synthase|uniref:Isoprenyl transferase n=1 Tax=Desulfobacca acetoxidans TaxID=60893 RepID=A0A7C5ELV8_9BACT